MSLKQTYKDAFEMLCGDVLGEGVYRIVYECKIDPTLVVKVEKKEYLRSFMNVRECHFWDDNQYATAISKWLAPCVALSPDGRLLLQRRAEPLRKEDLPSRLPSFLTDTKPCNYGVLGGRVVCVDYGGVIDRVSTRLKKVDWSS